MRRRGRLRTVLSVLAYGSLGTGTFAQTAPSCQDPTLIHESSTFELCPEGFSCAVSIFDQQFLGSRFHVSCEAEVTAVGGYLTGSTFGNQKIFAAIIALGGPTALPIGSPFDLGEIVATTAFDPGQPGSDVRTPLSATLPPGDYALVFGSGLFGASGDAGLEVTGTPLPGNSIFLWIDLGDGFTWLDLGEAGVRFVVEGLTDGQNPVILCPANAFGQECPADLSTGANGSPTASDNCGAVSLSSSDASVTGCGNTQSITRAWTATDGCGLTASCDQLLSTVDTTPPTISVDSSPILVTDTDCSGSESVSLSTGTANDACEGPVAVANDAPTTFPAGQTTTVTYTAIDGCGNQATATGTVTVRYGAEIEVMGGRHFVGQGTHPPCWKEPIAGEEFCAYSRANGSCAKTVCGGTSFQSYDCIVGNCPPVNCCTTGTDGTCTMDVPPGTYLVISQEVDDSWYPHRLAGQTIGTVHCGEHERVHVKQVVCASGRRYPCRTTRFTGSELLVAEPEFVVWDEPVQEYPFVLETVGDWGVTTAIAPPEGFVADYPQLYAQVSDELEAVQFTVTEVGSDLVPTKTTFRIRHKGLLQTFRSETGIRLTPDYARSRGFDPAVLRAKGILEERKAGNRAAMQE